MRTIWKYPIKLGETLAQVWAPGTKIVHFDSMPQDPARENSDHEALRFWIEHDPALAGTGRPVKLIVTGTGAAIPDGWAHCGTAVCGRFVWHLYVLYL